MPREQMTEGDCLWKVVLTPCRVHERKTISYNQSSSHRALENRLFLNDTILLKGGSWSFPKGNGEIHPKHVQDHLLPLGELSFAGSILEPSTPAWPHLCSLTDRLS